AQEASFASCPRVPPARQDHDRQAARTPRARVNLISEGVPHAELELSRGTGVLLDDGAARRADLDLVALGRVVAVPGEVRVVEEVEDEGAHLQPLALAHGQGIDGG